MSFLKPLLRDGAAGFVLKNDRTGAVVAGTILTAFDSDSRRTGLLKHDSLPAGSALIIAPTSAIHTFFMKFAIDVAFVSRDGRVLKTYSGLVPWRIGWAGRAYAVIELAAGALGRDGTRAGDLLAIEPEGSQHP